MKKKRSIETLLAIVDDETNAEYHTLTPWEHARVARWLKRRQASIAMANIAAAPRKGEESE